MRTSSVISLATILFLMAYIRPLEIILAKRTTDLVLHFHKKTTKLFFGPNMGQKSIKVLTILFQFSACESNITHFIVPVINILFIVEYNRCLQYKLKTNSLYMDYNCCLHLYE